MKNGSCTIIILHMGHPRRRGGGGEGGGGELGHKTIMLACALFIVDGLGHTMWSSTMPVSQSRTASFFVKSSH